MKMQSHIINGEEVRFSPGAIMGPEVVFDIFAYAKDVRESPAKYFTLAKLTADAQAALAIRRAKTLEQLSAAFQGPAKAAKADGDTFLLAYLKQAAKERKAQLEGAI